MDYKLREKSVYAQEHALLYHIIIFFISNKDGITATT